MDGERLNLSNDGSEAKGCARDVYNYNDYIKMHNPLTTNDAFKRHEIIVPI